jgi:hypothetical protein
MLTIFVLLRYARLLAQPNDYTGVAVGPQDPTVVQDDTQKRGSESLGSQA